MRIQPLIIAGALLTVFAVRADDSVCGKTGSVEARIAECRANLGQGATKTTYREVYDEKRKDFRYREFTWSLVTRITDSRQVWRDDETGLIWSEATTSDSVDYGFEGVHICPNYRFEMEMLKGRGISRHLKIDLQREKDYALDSDYRLPSVEDYMTAERHGIRNVLSDWRNNQQYWTSTPSDLPGDLTITPGPKWANTQYRGNQYFKIVDWAHEVTAEGERFMRPLHTMQAFMQNAGVFMRIEPGKQAAYVRCVTSSR